jgi:hypothetical protein
MNFLVASVRIKFTCHTAFSDGNLWITDKMSAIQVNFEWTSQSPYCMNEDKQCYVFGTDLQLDEARQRMHQEIGDAGRVMFAGTPDHMSPMSYSMPLGMDGHHAAAEIQRPFTVKIWCFYLVMDVTAEVRK